MKKISDTSQAFRLGMQAQADQAQTSMDRVPGHQHVAERAQDHPLNLLKKRLRKTAESSNEDPSLHICVPTTNGRLNRFISRSFPNSSSAPTTPGSGFSGRPTGYPGFPTLASLLDPPTPGSHSPPSDLSHASDILRNERQRTRDLRYVQQDVVLSLRTVRSLAANSQRPEVIERLSTMKPGALEIENGFLPVRLEGAHDSDPRTLQGMRPIGSGASGSAYAVRLAEDFWRAGENCGRDFVFKAMLCSDPRKPIPCDLYTSHLQDISNPKELVSLEKSKIYKEYQMIVSLDAGSRVMRAYGLVQIDNVFGILLEKIKGITVGNIIASAGPALKEGRITASDYLAVGRQLMADVLIAVSCCEDMGIVHQDISHNNVMYDEPGKMFRLIDMGLGGEEGDAPRAGTPGYIDMSSPASHARDVYSVAQLLVYFLKNPDYQMGYIGIFNETSEEKFPFMDALKENLPSKSKGEVIRFLNRMISMDANGRARAEDLLLDPFINDPTTPLRNHVHATYKKLT
ncbi:serine/threonine protein kinase [Xanthomonas fragariae]|uniref:serine/threonine protein kinase n=1 Tax=Xanthomonas fragariae TaxID=48664 RepID=UPI0022AA63E7|nr:serine/threonine-protein kinase [Xanthomonas fragariae]WAT14140.1 serine/threonine-protein kinase [Xanthomonas fragariae]